MIGVPLPGIKGKDADIELLLVIVAVAAFLLLVKHAKANGRISERTFTSRLARTRLQTSNAKVSDCAAICRSLLEELQRFKPIHDAEAEAKRRESKRDEQRTT